MMQEKFLYALLLLAAAIIWGQGFIATKWVLLEYTPLWSNAIRFAIAGFLSLITLIFCRSWKNNFLFWKQGFIASLFILGGMLFQIYGLTYTTVAKSGFLTTFYAFFIPLIGLAQGKRYRPGFWGLLFMAFMGVALLCDFRWDGFNRGDFLTLLCAISFALHILYLGKIAPNINNPFEFNAVQCFFMALISLPSAIFIESVPNLLPILNVTSWFVWGSAALGFLFLGIFSSFLAFAIQVYGQQKMSPAVAGVIFLLESPFAALFAYWWLGEKLSSLNIVGCLVVMLSVSLLPLFWSPPKSKKSKLSESNTH